MADFPFELRPDLTDRLARHFDVEGKIVRALESLGPVADRDVVLVDRPDGLWARQLGAIGARVSIWAPATAAVPIGAATASSTFASGLPDASADTIVGLWSSFRGVNEPELVEADRLLRPGGRLLVLHDYGRDDISRLRPADLPEYGAWSKRDGPFLRGGFKIRVVHCWWTFESIEEARAFLVDAFGSSASALADALKRPRLSYNVAIYHRTRPDLAAV